MTTCNHVSIQHWLSDSPLSLYDSLAPVQFSSTSSIVLRGISYVLLTFIKLDNIWCQPVFILLRFNFLRRPLRKNINSNKTKGKCQHTCHSTAYLSTATLYNHGSSGSWMAWASSTVAYYAALPSIACDSEQLDPWCSMTHILPPQSATLDLHSVACRLYYSLTDPVGMACWVGVGTQTIGEF